MPDSSSRTIRISRWLLAYVLSATTLEAQPSGEPLWRGFLQSYQQYSLTPLGSDELDAKARAAMIESAGARFRTWKPGDWKSVPVLADAMAENDPSVSAFSRVERTLDKLLPQIDRYGSYTSADEVSQWVEVLKKNPGSINMTLNQAPDGRVFCHPHEGGPAELAGINPGAMLMEVDHRPISGKSLSSIRLSFVGPPETPVALKIRQPQGKIEELVLTRTNKPSPKVSLKTSPLGMTLRIRSFDANVAKTVKSLLEAHPKPARLTIDLRGNPGGVRDEALKTASLFFPEGTVLGKFTTREGQEQPRDGNGVLVSPGNISIQVDEHTASAAEYLVAVLKEGLSTKVTIFGPKSYGKSHSTVGVPLEGGGKLTITEALLATGSGLSWDQKGFSSDLPDGEH